MFDRRQLLQKVDAGSAKEDAHLIGKAGAQALLAGAPRRFKVSRAYERVERSRSAPRASIILRANCKAVHKMSGMLKLPNHEDVVEERLWSEASGPRNACQGRMAHG